MSVSGVASVDVGLEKGLAKVKLKPGNAVTLKQLQDAITKNGFTMKESKLVAAGKIISDGKNTKLQISGSNEVLALVPEPAAVPAAGEATSRAVVVDGTIPEAKKGKTPDTIRYRSVTAEN